MGWTNMIEFPKKCCNKKCKYYDDNCLDSCRNILSGYACLAFKNKSEPKFKISDKVKIKNFDDSDILTIIEITFKDNLNKYQYEVFRNNLCNDRHTILEEDLELCVNGKEVEYNVSNRVCDRRDNKKYIITGKTYQEKKQSNIEIKYSLKEIEISKENFNLVHNSFPYNLIHIFEIELRNNFYKIEENKTDFIELKDKLTFKQKPKFKIGDVVKEKQYMCLYRIYKIKEYMESNTYFYWANNISNTTQSTFFSENTLEVYREVKYNNLGDFGYNAIKSMGENNMINFKEIVLKKEIKDDIKINYQMLKDKGACTKALVWFDFTYGKDIEISLNKLKQSIQNNCGFPRNSWIDWLDQHFPQKKQKDNVIGIEESDSKKIFIVKDYLEIYVILNGIYIDSLINIKHIELLLNQKEAIHCYTSFHNLKILMNSYPNFRVYQFENLADAYKAIEQKFI